MSFPHIKGTCNQRGPLLLIWPRSLGRGVSVGHLLREVTLPLPSHAVLFGRKSWYSPHLRSAGLSLRVGHPQGILNSLEFFHIGDLSLLLHLVTSLIIYSYQYGCMGIYLMPWATIQCRFVFLLLKYSWFTVFVSVWCIAQWKRTYIYILFKILFHNSLLQYIEYSAWCYTIGHCSLFYV